MTSFSAARFALGLPLTALAVLALLLAFFGFAVVRGMHRSVDVAWGLGFVVVAAVSYALSAGHGSGTTRALLLVLTAVWGLRLAGHIGWRGHGQPEDPRYADLVARAPGNPHTYALRKVYLTQAVVLWFVSLPIQVGMYARGGVTVVTMLGVLLVVVGLVFEAGGDWQLERFKRNPATRGTVLDTGLWHYTRHPNYFGDACTWWGLFAVAAAHWPGVLTLLSPLAMTLTLAKGTGKPLTEARMQGTRPEYADYVARTSGFIPLPARRRAVVG